MNSLARRRLRNSSLTLVAALAVLAYTVWSVHRLGRPDFGTGYLLLGLVVLLALYNVRKKLPVLTDASSTAWLQLHIYAGLLSAVVFVLHVDWRWPNGLLDTLLAGLYAATFASGLVGLYWTRTIPPKLTRVRHEFIYEQIPALRRQVHQRAAEVVLETVQATGSDTLAEFYTQRLQGYLEKPRGLGYWIHPTSKLRRRLLAELTEVTRYLSEPELQTSETLFALLRRRDDLDFHTAMQWRLKAWLFLHIALTYPLLVVAGLHGWLAHLFDGGLP